FVSRHHHTSGSVGIAEQGPAGRFWHKTTAGCSRWAAGIFLPLSKNLSVHFPRFPHPRLQSSLPFIGQGKRAA
ncbi:hypothetical protein ACCT30_44975, partial [Rhizobium ruizarguesonis]